VFPKKGVGGFNGPALNIISGCGVSIVNMKGLSFNVKGDRANEEGAGDGKKEQFW